MRFAFAERQLQLRDAVRDFLDKECTPDDVRAAADDGWARARWQALADLGVTGLTVPEAYGGLGFDELDLVPVLEEAGRHALPEPLLETVAVAVPLLVDVDAGHEWLGRVATGEAVLVAGLDLSPVVPYAASADLLLLQHGDDLHAVTPGEVRLVPQPSVDARRATASVEWVPSDATRIASGVAGPLGAAADRGALAAAADLLGAARRVVDLATAYALDREQFGRPIGSFQAIKHHLASALVRVEFARPVVYRAAHTLATAGPARSRDASMAKAMASDAAWVAARAALQVHGAIGYTWEHDLHLWLRRIWALAGAWGDADHHRHRVAAAIGIENSEG